MMKLKVGQSRATFGRSSGFPFSGLSCAASCGGGAKPLCTHRGSPNRVKQNRLAPRAIVEGHGSCLVSVPPERRTADRILDALLVTAPVITISPLCVMAPCDGPVCRYANR